MVVAVRMLVVGCGSIGRRHIANLIGLGVPAEDITAVDVPSALEVLPESVVRYPIVETPVELAKPVVFAAILVCSPFDRHLSWAADACQQQTALFIEKPLGSLDELPRWRTLAAKFDALALVTQVGYQLRFHPAAQALTSITSPVIGRFTCDAEMASWPGQSYGPMLLEMSHEIDLALASGASSERVSVDILTDTRAVFSLCGEGRRWRIDLNGQASSYHRSWYVANGGMHVEVSIDQPDALGADMYRAEMGHFLNAVRTGKQSGPAATLADGVKVLEICQSVMETHGAQLSR